MDFVIPEVAKDMVLPVQDFLRSIEKDAFLTPLVQMSDLVKHEFAPLSRRTARMKDSVDEHKEWLDKLDALETMIEATLRNSRTSSSTSFATSSRRSCSSCRSSSSASSPSRGRRT